MEILQENKKINGDKMLFNKKAMTWQQLVLAILAVVVVTLVIIWFQKGGEGAYGNLGEKISALGDYDNDNIGDLFDKCPCDAGTTKNKEFPGCPSTTTTDAKVTELNKDCDTKKSKQT